MISDQELLVLELLNGHLLAKLSEIEAALGSETDGVKTSLQRLISLDCVKIVEPIGEKCYVITHKGSKVLREAKNPESRVQRSEFMPY
jgi:hypothetical protein